MGNGLRQRAGPTLAAALAAVACTATGGCGVPAEEEQLPVRSAQLGLTVGGCSCPTSGNCAALSYSDIPKDSRYYVTTFGGGSDTQSMSCGGTADGKWAYIANVARFGCGARVLVEGNGKRCVAKVADCGPNRCVEQAASYSNCSSHFPIIDASPFITKYLFGSSSFGWSDKKVVTARKVADGTAVGCPGGAVEEPKPKADAAVPQPVDAGPPPPLDASDDLTPPPADASAAGAADATVLGGLDLGLVGAATGAPSGETLFGGCAVGRHGTPAALLALLAFAGVVLAAPRRGRRLRSR